MKEIICSAVLFDLDGVLVDSTPSVERQWKEWAQKNGYDPDEVIKISHGRRTIETLHIIGAQCDIAAEVSAFSAREALDLDGVEIMPGVLELLSDLPTEKWAVVTSGTKEVAYARLKHCGIPIPKVFITADDVQHGKPSPEGYLTAANMLQYKPEQCVIIEDAPAGIEAAKAAGIRVIAVATTHTHAELSAADAVAENISGVLVKMEREKLILLI